MRRRIIDAFLVAALAACSSGCGILYTSVTQPLTTNMHATPRGVTHGEGSTKLVSLPTVPVDLSAEWSSRGIGDAAQAANLKEIYYADEHTLSILLGIFEKDTTIVYGK
jgi:hypothetical protein